MNLAAYRTSVRDHARDGGATVWTDAQVDTALRAALEAYSRVTARTVVTPLTLTSGDREISLASLAGLLTVRELWLPYTPSAPEDPPNRRYFIPLSPTTVYIADGAEPTTGEIARVFYLALHTVDGLDGATATSVPAWHEQGLALGAAAYLAEARARQLTEAENVTSATRRWANDSAQGRLQAWQDWLAEVAVTESGPVAWQLPLLGFEACV
ncbi:MAG: hypothetical protein KIT87_00720 [Anaerolineae bacterium]|nr:hypothetical protein [Anaerolineae bacterium]